LSTRYQAAILPITIFSEIEKNIDQKALPLLTDRIQGKRRAATQLAP